MHNHIQRVNGERSFRERKRSKKEIYRERRLKGFEKKEQGRVYTCKDHIKKNLPALKTKGLHLKKKANNRERRREINEQSRQGLMKAGGCFLTAVMNNIQYY